MNTSSAPASAASRKINHIGRYFTSVVAAVLIAGCATVEPTRAPAPTKPPATVPAPPVAPVVPPAAPSTPGVPAAASAEARYQRQSFAALPPTADADWVALWPAMQHSCTVLARRDAWRAVCAQLLAVDGNDANSVRRFFAEHFDCYQVVAVAADGSVQVTGLMTGYYEPLLNGSRRRSARFHVPLYRTPSDLVVVDLASVYPELGSMRLRGRLHGQRLVPYLTRGEIDRTDILKGHELLWVDDPISAFFLQVQGSGRIRLEDGSTVRVGYAEHNGHPYRSIGRWLVDQGELALEQASMQGIQAWSARNPARLAQLLEQNPSYVFFREVPLGDPRLGPLGALGVPLTPGRSVAVDARHIPLGAPLIVATTHPSTQAALVQPMMAQDTGGAIRGPLRFDYFWGFGNEAGEHAGRQRTQAGAWLLVPRGADPSSLLKR